jgi:hypothetical protein
MGPDSKSAVVNTLGHLIDELLQQRVALRRIEDKLDESASERVALKSQVRDVERAHIRLRNQIDGLPPTPAE